MSKLRGVLCWCFGAFALVFLFAVPIIFGPLHLRGLLLTTSRGILGLVLVEAILAGPVLVSVTCGMAWWALSRRKASGRRWAIAASSVLLLQALVVSVAALSPLKYGHQTDMDEILQLLILLIPFLFVGIAGLVAFIPRNAVEQMPKVPAKAPRIAGDGTSGATDVFVWIVQFAGYIAALHWWDRWSYAHGLPGARFGLLPIVVSALLLTLLHECGHAITGTALGMKVRAFIVGPFQWRIRSGKWRFEFLPAKFLAAGGATALVPTNADQSHWHQIAMIAAGPLTNLCTGLIALYFALTPASLPNWQVWNFLALFATLSLLAFAGNLIPFRKEIYSDGARIYQILVGGPLADYNHLASIVTSSLVTPLRPRDFDIDALQKTARAITSGMPGLMLRLYAYEHFLDRGKLGEASDALMDAESFLQQSQMELPTELHTVFVFGNAFVRRDAAAARQWWEHMEAKGRIHFNVDYWRAKSALHWIEGDLEEANAAWKNCHELADRLPGFGAYESDRFSCALLREAMDRQPQAAGVAPGRA